MNGILAFCENKKCGAIFEVPSLVKGSGSAQIEFQDSRFGPCPKCGSFGAIPDGVYQYLNQVVSFVRGPKESVDKLMLVRDLLLKYKTKEANKEEIINEVNKISPDYANAIKSVSSSMGFDKWVTMILAILTAAILVQQTYFRGSDDEIKDKIIEQLLKQNENLIEKVKSPSINIEVKIGRNDPCHCGSGKKYKICCLKK